MTSFGIIFKRAVISLVVVLLSGCSTFENEAISAPVNKQRAVQKLISGHSVQIEQNTYVVEKQYYSALGKTCAIVIGLHNNKKQKACFQQTTGRLTLLPSLADSV